MGTNNIPKLSEDTLSNQGYRVQEDQVRRIVKRLENFKTVQCSDLQGRPIDPSKRGSDGGLDLIINIKAKTPVAEKRVETIVRNILLKNDY